MFTKLAKSLLRDMLKTKLAQEIVQESRFPRMQDVLRQYSRPVEPVESSSLSVLLADDPDIYRAASRADVSAEIAPYEFVLLDEQGNKHRYRFAVYKLMFQPVEPDHIKDSNADVKGREIRLQKEQIEDMVRQGKADKFVAGIESLEDATEKFDYDTLGIVPPDSKPSFMMEYDDEFNTVMPINQMGAIQMDYKKYVEELDSVVQQFSQKIAERINQEYGEEQPGGGMGMGASPLEAPPAPMGGGMPPLM